ncbi:MAG: DUF4386 domain-containing protein [Hellea sp.]
MKNLENETPQNLARITGWTLIASIGLGILSAMLIASGIDVNMTADIAGTAENMLGAETRLHAKAYLGLLAFALEAMIGVGLYLLLRKFGPLLAGWSLFVNLAAATLMLLGAVFSMNAAHIGGNDAFAALTDESGRLMLSGLQATSDYTSFHLALILTTAANAGIFYLFLKSGLIPKLIAGWGLFASIFVVAIVVARDFIPALGHGSITAAFMISNLVALISLGLFLGLKGVRAV